MWSIVYPSSLSSTDGLRNTNEKRTQDSGKVNRVEENRKLEFKIIVWVLLKCRWDLFCLHAYIWQGKKPRAGGVYDAVAINLLCQYIPARYIFAAVPSLLNIIELSTTETIETGNAGAGCRRCLVFFSFLVRNIFSRRNKTRISRGGKHPII